MRNVVLQRELVERVRVYVANDRERINLIATHFHPAGAHPRRDAMLAEYDQAMAALDAALAAPEPFVRLLTSWRELREERDTFTSDWDDVEEAIFLLTGKWATP